MDSELRIEQHYRHAFIFPTAPGDVVRIKLRMLVDNRTYSAAWEVTSDHLAIFLPEETNSAFLGLDEDGVQNHGYKHPVPYLPTYA